jgi:hypothetical protein
MRYNMHFHPQNKYSMFYKYNLSSMFSERDIKAMQKEKRMGHIKVLKYRKKREGDTMKVPKVFKKKEKENEHIKAHEKNKVAVSQIQKQE